MNTEHLGDAYDYVKKVILETLKAGLKEELKEGLKEELKEGLEGLKRKIYVLPMFTDTFEGEELAFYRNLTSYDEIERRVIFRVQTTGNIDTEEGINRPNYFDFEVNNRNLDNYIVFIDPNTGIKDEQGHGVVNYEEIANVARDNNILVVYDQSFNRDWKGTLVNWVQKAVIARNWENLTNRGIREERMERELRRIAREFIDNGGTADLKRIEERIENSIKQSQLTPEMWKRNEIRNKIAIIQKNNGPHCFYLNLNGNLGFAFISKDKNLLKEARELLIKRNVALLSRLIPEENSSQVEPQQ